MQNIIIGMTHPTTPNTNINPGIVIHNINHLVLEVAASSTRVIPVASCPSPHHEDPHLPWFHSYFHALSGYEVLVPCYDLVATFREIMRLLLSLVQVSDFSQDKIIFSFSNQNKPNKPFLCL